MGRWKPPSWVFLEWEAIVFGPEIPFGPDRPLEQEYLDRARALHARTFVDGRWTVDIEDAKFVTSALYYLEFEWGNYEASELRIRELLMHPDYNRLDGHLDGRARFEATLAAFEISRGEVKVGLERLRAMPRDRYRTMDLHQMALAISLVLESPIAVSEPLAPELIAYIREFALAHSGMTRRVAACGDGRAELIQLYHEASRRPPVRNSNRAAV